MKSRSLHIISLVMSLMMLTYINSAQVAASSVGNDVEVDEQTRQMLMEKYGLEPTEESQAQQHFLSGNWGMSFSQPSDVETMDKLMLVVPFWLWPGVWIIRMWV